MFKTRIYLYDSTKEDYRGAEYSDHILINDNYKEDISQELDTAEFTLAGLNFRQEFAPETKFIMDKVEVDESGGEEIIYTFHLCVDKDMVSQPNLAENDYFDHHIFCYEPSVVAQKRLCDNISATYKLKDVSLETPVAFDTSRETIFDNIKAETPTPTYNYGSNSFSKSGAFYNQYTYGKLLQYEGVISVDTSSASHSIKYYNEVTNEGQTCIFVLPKLAIYHGIQGSKNLTFIGYASIDWKVEVARVGDPLTVIETYSGTSYSRSDFSDITYPYYFLSGTGPRYNQEWLVENINYSAKDSSSKRKWFNVRRYSSVGVTENYYDETIIPMTDTIPFNTDMLYRVTVTIHNYTDNAPTNQITTSFYQERSKLTYPVKINQYREKRPIGLTGYNQEYNNISQYNENEITASSEFITYTSDSVTKILKSANPYSALSLIQKAVLNCGVYEKVRGYNISDLNARDEDGKLVSNVPFYIDEDYIEMLSTTQVVENFYNQKNLWEILCEIGYYIHAVPGIKFGEDDRFMITFNQLGRTDKMEHKGQVSSIMNFRGVEDYISSVSSYVTNMVQLGGYIEEVVSPKTSSEDYLVYNDTAQIITSKPIIELLSVEVTCHSASYGDIDISLNDSGDMTPFIYEEAVYNLLPITYSVKQNRGTSLYYKLGDNKILGGDYRTPNANNTIVTDYAIKKAIYNAIKNDPNPPDPTTVSGYWSKIKVNDFTFKVKYRTKDSVRQTQTRPDLRKYLLSSKYDKVPYHAQFNNQTDTYVDSNAFGSMVYGKLIRTGNAEYRMSEWNDSLQDLKHKGELYDIDGELYYVAKVTHSYFSDYIESVVEYSKDYNQLSQVVGIPSEPRFYEISEKSSIQREISIDDYIVITPNRSDFIITEPTPTPIQDNSYMFNFNYIGGLIFGEVERNGITIFEQSDYPKYVVTTFKTDNDYVLDGEGEYNFKKQVLSPINAYSSMNTLTIEWDMVDNFSAGNKVETTEYNDRTSTFNIVARYDSDHSYKTLRAVQYCDVYGKSSLFDFYILKDMPALSFEAIQSLPEMPANLTLSQDTVIATNNKEFNDEDINKFGLSLIKDSREVCSFNYNLMHLSGSDTIIISPFVFEPNKKNVSVVFLNKEVNKLTNGYINDSDIIQTYKQGFVEVQNDKYFPINNFPFIQKVSNFFQLNISYFSTIIRQEHLYTGGTDGYQEILSWAIIFDTDEPSKVNKHKFIYACNLQPVQDSFKQLSNRFLGLYNKLMFKNKQ